ncbi:dihydroorotase [Apilactobacillus micheneri]|uniref:Dihydroorotase n=1 Tax=Apilactobacillus micheneri TaxID=1899430 RepID=A0A9Q8IN38_9LACO|nr:dihydroorotase [Apilactobacillus micheneri]TPR41098.1 dihydroorotase [Apilactobacillus micheneri]TPR42678.1 dihydroorotase [Apilactobacillus micheneri]TPR45646.1 dihydroorotase [Apilactobacillus micheneri]TPR46205.1 dihydroorotase [Apilactobacillus micheneri]TPR46890.1 dihydroorotase [Apilactobacillus micheneri]
MKLLIKHTILNNNLVDLLIENGVITSIAPEIMEDDAQIFDAKHHTILPGLVDVHVHFRDPGLTYKETIATGSKAAAHGGFTSVLAMPNVRPAIDNPKVLKEQLERNKKKSLINIYQFAAISSNLIAYKTADIEKMAKLGAIGFTNDGHGVQDAETMYQAMLQAKLVNKPISAHVEDDSLINGGVMNAGSAADKLGLPGMNPLSEASQLARDLVLAKASGVHYHVAHISTKESVDLLRIAKKEGVNVTAEVSPHHLLLDDEMIEMDNPMMKMNPPLRTPTDRKALIGGLLDGTIDMIATDHAPHSEKEKSGSMLTSSFGIVGLETAFSLIYTHFVKSGLVDMQTLINWMSNNPAQKFNMNAGVIKVGAPADLTIMDLVHPYKIDAKNFLSKGKNSPFIGEKVYGKTMATFVAGKLVYQNGGNY